MEFTEYVKIKRRMTKGCRIRCENCPLSNYSDNGVYTCVSLDDEHPEEAEAIVKKWAEEHPAKTRLSGFLRLFPNAKLNEYGFPYFCIKIVTSDFDCSKITCKDCMRQFWEEQIEESKKND